MANDRLDVMVICGSLRQASYNAALVRALPKLAPPEMTLTSAPSYAGFPLYNHDLSVPPDVKAFTEAVHAADGVLIVSPEYHATIPGPLTNALDWVTKLQTAPFKGKPVAIQSVSPSNSGGLRMQQHLRGLLLSIEAYCLGRPEVFISDAKPKFDERTLELTHQPTADLVRQQLAAFADFIRRMAPRG